MGSGQPTIYVEWREDRQSPGEAGQPTAPHGDTLLERAREGQRGGEHEPNSAVLEKPFRRRGDAIGLVRGRALAPRPVRYPVRVRGLSIPVRVHGPSTRACPPTRAPTPHANAEARGLPTDASVRAVRGNNAPARAGRDGARTGERQRSTGRCTPDPCTSRRS